ncbi:hypothetical protein IC229_15655 [Spirosoma sp. BT702]|uniref:Thioredoxin domain-containing protein n=1 Tax=Spirosoma profusum TaxID=2771354 RepID=A0A927ARD4_9BACT|nr:hypothetical protein [Spirosoma profusum]
MNRRYFYLLLFTGCFHYVSSYAQSVDSVIVTGRIRNLSARLYREAPTVFMSRTNILQANRELVRPAPLNLDGTFRVSLPLIYPQEELFFNYGRISTALLASPGTLTIDLDADSLFSTAVPFKFGGVNAQVNQQFARYKAFEASYPNKPDGKKLSNQVNNMGNEAAYKLVASAYRAPFAAFAAKEKPFPLLVRWVGYTNRYNAAAFLYDKAAYENDDLSEISIDSLRPVDDQILTLARASAMNRFANYVTQRVSTTISNNGKNGLSVRVLSTLLDRYGKDLTADERLRLNDYALKNSARAADLRFFERLVQRSPDTLQRLVNYETMIERSRQTFDGPAVSYMAAYWLASTLPGLTLDFAHLLYDYARPQVNDSALGQSLDELYRLEIKDSTRIRAAVQTLQNANTAKGAVEISPGVFFTQNRLGSGATLFDQVINSNRGKVIYVLMVPNDEAGRQAAQDAQRLRSAYRPRDFALIYVPMPDTNKQVWPEIATRYNLTGDHLLLTDNQLFDAVERMRADGEISAMVINRTGKIIKRNAPLPADFEEAQKLLDKNL